MSTLLRHALLRVANTLILLLNGCLFREKVEYIPIPAGEERELEREVWRLVVMLLVVWCAHSGVRRARGPPLFSLGPPYVAPADYQF